MIRFLKRGTKLGRVKFARFVPNTLEAYSRRRRDNRTFDGLPLQDALRSYYVDACTGLLVLDTQTGAVVE